MNPIQQIVAAIALAGAAGGTGYVWGRIDGHRLTAAPYEAKIAAANVELAATQHALSATARAFTDQAARLAASEASKDALQQEFDNAALSDPTGAVHLSPDSLRRVRAFIEATAH